VTQKILEKRFCRGGCGPKLSRENKSGTAESVTAAWFSIKLDIRQHIFSIVSEFSETSFAPHLSCFIAESKSA
jgi:hypothetical protein